jgi:hypothetical protein
MIEVVVMILLGTLYFVLGWVVFVSDGAAVLMYMSYVMANVYFVGAMVVAAVRRKPCN